MDNEWPNSDSHIGKRDHLHALGVITTNFNELELELLFLFTRYAGMEKSVAQKLWGSLANQKKRGLILDGVDASEADPIVKDLVVHFLNGFDIAEYNRNFFAHSLVATPDSDQGHLSFGKGVRHQPDIWSFAHMKLEEIRRIADEISALRMFGWRINLWLIGRGKIIFGDGHSEEVILPEKRPLPKRLVTVTNSKLVT
jgi:hypothetical protein